MSLALQGLFGFFALHALAWAASENRRAIAWRPVIAVSYTHLTLPTKA